MKLVNRTLPGYLVSMATQATAMGQVEEMAGMSMEISLEDLVVEMTDRAKALWGEERAAAISAALQQAARQLQEVDRTLPGRDVEPGFYQ